MGEIDGGYFLIARRLTGHDSWLMSKPPLYLKLWVWMLGQSNFRDRDKLRRGQFVTSIAEMQKAMAYRVGYRLQTPTRDEIRSAYEAFTRDTMITTTKTTRGMIVTICNYGKYQDLKNYETHNQPHNENTTKPTVSPHDTEGIIKKVNLNPSYGFDTFWLAYPKKQSKQQAEKSWQKIRPDSELLATIMGSLDRQKASDQWQRDSGQYIPLASSWLNQRRWEDELPGAQIEGNQRAALNRRIY